MYRAYALPGSPPSFERVPADYQPVEGDAMFGDPPSEAELAAAFPAQMLAQLAAARCIEVDAQRDAAFAAGMVYGGKTLQLRDVDQQRIIAAGAEAKFALITASAWPADFAWIMADNSTLPLDAAGMSAMADAAAAKVQAWIFNGHTHKQAIRALADAAAIAAYDITTGWQ